MLPSKYLVFDFGGTLADYENLPMAWADYYPTAFEYVSRDFNITFSQTVISQATEILKSYNARFYPRKTEISDTTVFESVNNALKIPAAPKQIAQSFYKNLSQTAFLKLHVSLTVLHLKFALLAMKKKMSKQLKPQAGMQS